MTRATLALADGTVFHGKSFGAEGHTTGEVVFTTGMSGYQEVLTDPSFTAQIVTMTSPNIGNTGVNPLDPGEHALETDGRRFRGARPQVPSSRTTEVPKASVTTSRSMALSLSVTSIHDRSRGICATTAHKTAALVRETLTI